MFKKKPNSVVQLSGEIDVPNNVVSINPTSGDPWLDFGYWLEATSLMAKQAMLDKGWSEAQMKEYIQAYLAEALVTYSPADDKDDQY